jgi:hypothetical protein
LIPACLLSQPNSFAFSLAPSTTSFFFMYSLYSLLLDALCSHAAPHSSSSWIYLFSPHHIINTCVLFISSSLTFHKMHALFINSSLKLPIITFSQKQNKLNGIKLSPGNLRNHSRKGKPHCANLSYTVPCTYPQTQRPTRIYK